MSHPLSTAELTTVSSGEKVPRRRLERGLATVEYAIGIVLVLAVIGVLIWATQTPYFKDVVEQLVRTLFEIITKTLMRVSA